MLVFRGPCSLSGSPLGPFTLDFVNLPVILAFPGSPATEGKLLQVPVPFLPGE